MKDKVKVMVVDDDHIMRELIEAVLSPIYQIIAAEDGADALMLAQAEHPALILLDVEMKSMGGYETCRRLKLEAGTAQIPVIFVSGHDQVEERLKGYEVGGNDYVIKPFEPEELKAKIAHQLTMVAERAQLKELAGYATNTAMTAMTSLSEMGILLESMKNFSASINERALVAAILTGLSAFGLEGVVQVRTPDKKLTFTGQGEASPLEISVIENMSGMDRVIQFKKRISICYPHVSILVNNMPVEDTERCGRLRDHLAMLIEGAEMRSTGIAAENESRQRGGAIDKTVSAITKMLAEVDAAQRLSKLTTLVAIEDFTDGMEKACIRLGLSEAHERYIADFVRNGLEKIAIGHSDEVDMQNKLSRIIKELKGIVN